MLPLHRRSLGQRRGQCSYAAWAGEVLGVFWTVRNLIRKDGSMPRIKRKSQREGRRSYADEFKQEALQMLLDGHSATSVAE